jgi:asparagine synthase (glutamine-hydrolysing)
VSYGLALGTADWVEPLPADGSRPPRAALEAVALRALRRPPCVVSFSGGLDSSALLALMTSVARREGLDDPIPATLEFPGSAESDELRWQELVLGHLGLSERIRLPIDDELDALGPYATRALERHGLLWPFNLHFHLPIIEAARGGTVVTGFGGDELGRSSAGLRAERVLARRRVANPRAALHLAYRLAPAPLTRARELVRGHDLRGAFPYLTPKGRVALRLALVGEHTHPFGWSKLLRHWMWRSRYVQVCRSNFELLGAGEDVATVHPFVEPELLGALGEDGRFAGLGPRRELLTALLGDLLPDALLARTTKGRFSLPLWTATARAFAAAWSGHGLDTSLVDPAAVRAAWLADAPPVMTTTMLQAAWLADR